MSRYATGATEFGPGVGAFAITPSDGSDLPHLIRGIIVGGDGTVSFVSSVDGNTYTTGQLSVGTILPVFAKQVLSTNTTATNLTGLM